MSGPALPCSGPSRSSSRSGPDNRPPRRRPGVRPGGTRAGRPSRCAPRRLVHHSDRGVQYLSIRYTERLAAAEAVSSVGSRGDSYDNALAETVNGLFKAELIERRKPWRSVAEVELATAEWVDWWNQRRLHEACGYVPPAEYEAAYHARQVDATAAA
jgi:putative transposase